MVGRNPRQIESGALLAANATVTFPTSWQLVDNTQDFAARWSGVIIPDTTGNYDFFLACDDDTDLFISTNDLPAGKYLVAQETQWSNARNWNTPGAGPASQKRSDQWTNSVGVAPYTAGIHLVAGTRYYLEADYHGGGGGNLVGVTMVPTGTGVADGTDTVLTNAFIGVVIPVPTTLSFTRNPSNTTVYASMAAYLKVTTATDSAYPVAYQWRRGGVNITGATASTYSFVASTNDDGAQFDCEATVPGPAVPGPLVSTSAVATVTVPISGGLAVQGFLKRELFTGAATAGGDARTVVENGNNSTPNSVNPITVLDLPSAGQNYAERVNGFFTPATTGYYVFFVAADDDTDVYVSTNNQPANKQLVAQESGWSGIRSWNLPGGAGSLAAQNVRISGRPMAEPPYRGPTEFL